MLRRRRPVPESSANDQYEFPTKQHGKGINYSNSFRVLASTLFAAVLAAVKPSQDIQSQAYSEYLTSQVQGLTIGWHIFRTITEGAFLMTYGFAFNTIVVQVFWTISVCSVLLHFLRRTTWLRWRESVCVGANVVYGAVTVLKIFNLLDRLPNENHYLFKHCFLTMADAAFSQTPVHKQYVVQLAEAVIRVIVWRRYNVLAYTCTWGVVAISLIWQLWLVTFSSILQARHVNAFRRQRATSATAAAGTSSSTEQTAASLPASSSSSNGTTSTKTCATSAAAAIVIEAPGVIETVSAPPSVFVTGSHSSLDAAVVAPSAAARAAPRGGDRLNSPATQLLRASLSAGGSSASSAVPQKSFMRVLRSVAQGPSSYVMLSHQRHAGGSQTASVQWYISSASPDMLPAIGHWREKLATVIAQGAPGWQVVNVCVRKGSLIVHLDLVYVSTSPGTVPSGGATALATTATTITSCSAPGITSSGGVGVPFGASFSEQPFVPGCSAAYPDCSPETALDDYLGGMDADCLMELLGLTPDVNQSTNSEDGIQSSALISVQIGEKLRILPTNSSSASTTSMPTPMSTQVCSAEPVSGAHPEEVPVAAIEPPGPVATVSTPKAGAWTRLVAQPIRTALKPPADLYSPQYAVFLSGLVGALHLTYSATICFSAVVLATLRGSRGINQVTLLLFLSAELLSLVAYVLLGGRGGGEYVWRRMRCQLVYVGVAMRSLQMAACTSGFLPRVLTDTECISGRWTQVVITTTLQALCMQPPVRSFFLIRVPSLLLYICVQVLSCPTLMALAYTVALHMCWEGLLFVVSANLQLRHLEAFWRDRTHSDNGLCCCQDTHSSAASKSLCSDGGVTSKCATRAGGQELLLQPPGASRAAADLSKATNMQLAGELTDVTAHSGSANVMSDILESKDSRMPALVESSPLAALWSPAASAGDPFKVSLSTPLVAMVPRRAARLELLFTCAPSIVEELHVVLRHINPAAMSSGIHAAHAVRDITHALVAPAAAASPYEPVAFCGELTLVASPADMPGLMHVELWRGRRRVCSHPVLLAAAPEAAPALLDGADDITASAGSGTDSGSWLDDVCTYVQGLQEQGHTTPADQYVEELGSWMAQVAALERGLIASASASCGGAIANVLYFHGNGSDFMYVKPQRVSSGAAASAVASVAPGPSADPVQCALRQLLLRQGSMLLAVGVEAGYVAMAKQLRELMVGKLGATTVELMDARTPVTQLPLLHAAVKSTSVRMVDLIAEWAITCGLQDIWATEAAILSISLESYDGSALGDTSLQHTSTSSSAFFAAPVTTVAAVDVAAAAASKAPIHQFQSQDRSSTCSAVEAHSNDDVVATYVPTAEVPASLGSDVFSMETQDMSEVSPFRVIDFRASNRAVAGSGRGSGSGQPYNALAAGVPYSSGSGRVSTGPEFSGGGGSCSLDGLVDGGVLVLTPLHMSLALGDEGRLATHILRTYPEAYELWRMSQQANSDPDSDIAASVSGNLSNVRQEGSGGTFTLLTASPQLPPLLVSGSSASRGSMMTRLAAAAPAFTSLPGLTARSRVGSKGLAGGGYTIGGCDSVSECSLQSISLSEMAFHEGLRWIEEEVPAKRPDFKVARVEMY